MSADEPPLRFAKGLSPEEEAAARLTQAGAAQEATPDPSVRDRAWKNIDARVNRGPKRFGSKPALWAAAAVLLGGVALYSLVSPKQTTAPSGVIPPRANDPPPLPPETKLPDVQPASVATAPPEPARDKAKTKEPTLAEALAHARAGRYTAAESMYRRIAERVPEQAEIALIALAKMKTHYQKRHGEALQILAELEKRYGRSPLHEERLLARIEILFRAGRCDEAKAAVATYVQSYSYGVSQLRDIDASQCSGSDE